MKRSRILLAPAAALAAALVVVLGGRAPRSRAPARPLDDALRDAPNDPFPGDLARRHAPLAKDRESSCALCHLVRQSAALRALWRSAAPEAAEPSAAPLDDRAPSSRVCLSCHDGASGGGYMLAFANIKGNHPIGADYRAAWLAAPAAYNPPGPGSGIRLEDGKVGCRSCHRLHDRVGARAGVERGVCKTCHRN